MKKTLFVFIFSCLGAALFAQGNLQFNAVKFYELTIAQTSTTVYLLGTQSITVPAGKVWKVESAGCASYQATNNLTSSGGFILLDGRIISATGYGPVWLVPGTYTVAIQGNTLASGYSYNGYFSAIEFNIVP